MKQIKDGQKYALIKLCARFTQDRAGRLYLVSKLLDKPVKSTNDLTIADWQKIRNEAYPNWPDDDWEVSRDFAAKANEISHQYQIEELGQLTLF